MENIHAGRIGKIRELMYSNGWDAVIITGSDPHASEYPAPRWKQVEWLSGFTGEAGDLAVTMDHAGLWTDSRYFIQAEEQLAGSGIELHKTRIRDSVSIPEWLAGKVSVVAVDGLCQTAGFIKELQACMEEGNEDCRIIDVPDMLDRIWDDRPYYPSTPVTTVGEEVSGESRFRKITWLRKFLMKENCDAVLVTSLDEIAWLLNVRGNDIEYNPLVISYLLVTMDSIKWYVRKVAGDSVDQETADSFAELESDGVEICSYDDVAIGLTDLSSEYENACIYIDPGTMNYNVYKQIISSFPADFVKEGTSPVILRKAVKNNVEIRSLREAYLEDGIVMEKFLFWLEKSLKEGRQISEYEVSEKLTSLRSEVPGYRGNSFANISAYGKNAALPHYSTPVSGSALLRQEGLYLVDSGGQYIFGTTDITRTVPLGPCTAMEMEDYTLVLKGMIQLASAVFPYGTAGCQLDILARNALWRSHRNFGHGTGHGIGFYLCVHEGPQDIRQNFNSQPILPGMVISDEPGIYREGSYGIRHENVLLCVGDGGNDFGDWLRFETLTCCHIDTSAIVRNLMTADELKWLDEYNERVFRTLSPCLDTELSEWLYSKTRGIQ